jgi:AraC-like DNA-binding protein
MTAYREFVPHPALRPFVDRFWTRRGAGEGLLRILPDGCIDVLVSERSAFVVGTMTRALVIEARSPARTFAVRFRPGGAAPFLRNSAYELTDREVACTDLGFNWPSWAQLRESGDLRAAICMLERVLLERLPTVQAPEPLVAHAVHALFGPAPPPVAQLAKRIGWSRQYLRRAFQVHVGVGPKELGKVARLQRAVALVQRAGSRLAEAAVTAGYFDEAHMDREFRQLIGVTPGTVRAAPGSIRPIPSLFEMP